MKQKQMNIYTIILFLMLLTSCRSVKYVPVESVHMETKYIDKLVQKHDSVYLHDSIYSYIKGDTVFWNKYRTKYVNKYIFGTDSIYLNKTDSIRVPYPVEKQFTKWQKVEINTGRITIIALIVLAILSGVYIFVKDKIRK
ncbi:MAG: hypothetical protein GX416_03985 [Bacteroidales bacterium]|nr:hypothetical protein [Bacteroidales bacterium]